MSFANSFKALSHPVRREILNLLKTGRLSAGEIVSYFELTGATISHHLTILKAADLIREMKEKNFIYYELNTSVLEDMMVWLAELTTAYPCRLCFLVSITRRKSFRPLDFRPVTGWNAISSTMLIPSLANITKGKEEP